MSTKASLKALTDPINAKTRWSHRFIIYNSLKGCKMTNREIAAKVRLKYEQVWKRTSELDIDKILIIVGEKEENGQTNSIYMINPNPPKEIPEHKTIRQFLDEEHPHILFEYNARFNHEL